MELNHYLRIFSPPHRPPLLSFHLISGHRETRTPLLQSPLHQFDKGGQIYSLLMLCTHYICSPMRNRTSPHRLKVYCLHLFAIGEFIVSFHDIIIYILNGYLNGCPLVEQLCKPSVPNQVSYKLCTSTKNRT